MSYRVISQTRDGLRELVADTSDDLETIKEELAPLAMGSSAFVIHENKIFMLDGSGDWVELD